MSEKSLTSQYFSHSERGQSKLLSKRADIVSEESLTSYVFVKDLSLTLKMTLVLHLPYLLFCFTAASIKPLNKG